ncbi:MAG: hypothetical protein JSW27_26200 [Phycisphaerales bacterium]|nr:MAG: hypothetical protein JSW27_26200 [Phycisphaerales bacterium]
MQAVTLTLAGFFSVLALLSRPTRALAVYFILLLAYPTFLVVQLGPLDISAARIVGGVLFLRCLFDPNIAGKLKWCRLDTWVIVVLMVTVGVPLIAWKMPTMKVLENRGGFAMDTVMAYFIARFCIRDYRSLVTVAKWVTPVVIALAILGILESSYGIQPFFALRKYCPWRSAGGGLTTNVRSGYFRAVGPSGHPILFGASFVMFLPLLWSLRHESGPWKTRAYIAVAFASIGALSSMSSGPWMMLFMIAGAFMLEKHKGAVKPMLWFGIASCFVVDILSNRTFYHVMASYANPIGGSGWHRARLIDLAIERFGEWWLLGYRGEDPGWGSRLGMAFTDITNNYIMMGVFYGVWGMIGLIGTMAAATIMIVRAHNQSKDKKFQSWCWAYGSLLAVLAISFTSCTFFDQSQTYFYAVLGIIASMALGQPALERAQERRRIARLAQAVARPREPVIA